MGNSSLVFRDLDNAAFGVSLEVDPARTLSDDDRDLFRRRFAEHHLLVVRDTEMSWEYQQELVGILGPLIPGGEQSVSNVTAHKRATEEFAWHMDIPFAPHPYEVISLYGLEVEAGRTSTMFSDMVHAYRTLPPALRERIGRLQAEGWLFYCGKDGDGQEMPARVVSLIAEHPLSGDTMLVLDKVHSKRVLGVSEAESDEILAELFAHQYAAAQTYEHFWHQRDLVIWDNRVVHHSRGSVEASKVGRRILRRVAGGVESMAEQFWNAGLANQLDPDERARIDAQRRN